MRAIFTSFDNFMATFIAVFGVVWSTMFMPLLGGPLHTYEARAIGAGWQSLQSGQAASISEALQVATSLPVEAVFPSASAHEMPAQLMLDGAPEGGSELLASELLGGPDMFAPPMPRVQRALQRAPAIATPMVEIQPIAEPACNGSGACGGEGGAEARTAST